MSDSFKNFSTNLDRMALKKKRKEVKNWQEVRQAAELRQRESERKLAEYLRLKGEDE